MSIDSRTSSRTAGIGSTIRSTTEMAAIGAIRCADLGGRNFWTLAMASVQRQLFEANQVGQHFSNGLEEVCGNGLPDVDRLVERLRERDVFHHGHAGFS